MKRKKPAARAGFSPIRASCRLFYCDSPFLYDVGFPLKAIASVESRRKAAARRRPRQDP
jgi:hypothetical protein